jgi:hypothetical protein
MRVYGEKIQYSKICSNILYSQWVIQVKQEGSKECVVVILVHDRDSIVYNRTICICV